MALADRYGRKQIIIYYSIISIVGESPCHPSVHSNQPGCALQAGAVNMPMMIVGRLIGGFAMGALTSVGDKGPMNRAWRIFQLATLYQAEISPSHVRGMMTAATKFVNNWGFFTANW